MFPLYLLRLFHWVHKIVPLLYLSWIFDHFITSLSNSEMLFLWVQDHYPTHPFERLEVALGATAKPRNDVQGGMGTRDRENVVMMWETWLGGWTWHAGWGRRMRGFLWLTVSCILACLMLVYRRGPILYSYWGSTATLCYVSDWGSGTWTNQANKEKMTRERGYSLY